MIAPGADRILSARRSGLRPGSDVVVSTIGGMSVDCLVDADLDTEYDWHMLVDLDVWIVASTKTDPAKLMSLIWSIRKHRPREIRLWLDDAGIGYHLFFVVKVESIKRPVPEWEWEMEQLPLLKFQNAEMKRQFSGVAA